MHPLLYIIFAIIIFEALWDFFLGELNRKSWSDKVPKRLEDVYPQDKFQKQKEYRIANYRFGLFSSAVSTILILMVLWYQGFGWLHYTVENFIGHKYLQPLVYFGAIGLGSMILSLPFSIYSTFVIEERFGFNRTTKSTFITDLIKSLLLGALIGGLLLWLVVWFYHTAGSLFWLYAWGGLSLFMIFFSKFYTTLILPLFNKLTPLEEGELKSAIESMSRKAGFSLENVYVMDGSKRSTKANAFFSGFGENKRIVLFDTLINDLDKDEIVAVLAHEIGHYRLKHTIRGTILGILQTGITLFLLGWFINHPGISQALGVASPVFHVALLGFGLLYSPISAMAGLGMTILSRRQEYQADAFAAKYANASALQSALKKISATALNNPTPHPWFVFFNYSHPPLLKRLEALDSFTSVKPTIK
ncbi:M48 family metallopeptidase [Alkalitalea saponilacus]|uniref:STE24 endopeptidase n=1 Tax=Alkalitalea saponilacus TaxID=889453 RepID=A0A1T5DDE3_9BACT|nr:M48 family metallopeptidase [Alkalitalea saponilacus]ASB50670.1 peptidase M48 [Alkalitalea saponilacus]SKB69715.1 STE24 endopeptidase [Alkalitalea saponilacus]